MLFVSNCLLLVCLFFSLSNLLKFRWLTKTRPISSLDTINGKTAELASSTFLRDFEYNCRKLRHLKFWKLWIKTDKQWLLIYTMQSKKGLDLSNFGRIHKAHSIWKLFCIIIYSFILSYFSLWNVLYITSQVDNWTRNNQNKDEDS